MEMVKAKLVTGDWIFSLFDKDLKSNFVKKSNNEILKSFNTDDLSITYLAHHFYNKNKSLVTLDSKKSEKIKIIDINDNEISLMNSYLVEYFKNSEIENDSTIKDRLNLIIEDLNQSASKDNQLKECLSFLEYIIPVKKSNFRGASHPHFLGSIFLNISDTENEVEIKTSIIHEMAHQELFLLNFIDRLVNEKYDYNLIHAPYQNKLRPPIGRLHSLHALYRMLQYNKQDKLVEKYQQNLSSFANDELTQFSHFLINEVYKPYEKNI